MVRRRLETAPAIGRARAMTERLAYRIVSVLAALIALTLLSVMVLPSLDDVTTDLLATRWERTEGRVVSHTVTAGGRGVFAFSRGGSFLDVTYEYRAEGEVHTRQAPMGRLDVSERAEDAVARLRESGLVVLYRSGRPAEAMLERDGSARMQSWVALALGLVFLVLAAYAARRLWRESHLARDVR